MSELEPTPSERRVDAVLGLLRRAAAITGGVALVVIVAAMGWQVFGRYVLNATPTWAEALAILLISFITFLLTAVGVAERTHLSVDFVREAMPTPIARALAIVRDLLILGFGAVMAVQAYQLVQFNWRRNLPLLDIPEGVRAIPPTICGVLMVVFAAVLVWRQLRSRPVPPLQAPEAPTGEGD
ncbi:MAG: TRAP transporter small permease [Geminicoccaceae bacterium]|nr:MAG: TRAP transporter small permease [Geminicoccaceae bacterium]